jgi:surface carbohydrate biosynthesis protein
MRVLLVIDSFDREYLSMRLLQSALRRRGVDARLCSRVVLGMSFNRFKPQVVVIPKTHKIVGLETIYRSSVVVLAQAESFSGSRNAFLHFSTSIKKEFVDIVNCWGEFDRDIYLEKGLFSPDQVVVNGHPITESWYLSSRISTNISNPVVGIAMSIRAFTHKANGPNANPVECVINAEDVGDSGYFLPPYHAEDWIAYEASWIRVVYQLIKENRDIRFVIRPHPLENSKLYEVFTRLPNVQINSHGHISEWLSTIDVLCSAFSTSMLDAYFRKIPVVSIKKLIPNRILTCIHPAQTGIPHDAHFAAPDTFPDLRSLLHKVWRPISELDTLGRQVYNFPHERRPSEGLAETIVHCSPSLFENKKAFERVQEGFFERLCGPFGWSPDLRLVLLHLRDMVGHTNITAAAYGRHRILRNRKYSSLVKQISAL